MTRAEANSRDSDAFVRIVVRVQDAETGERLAADAFEAGAAGLEERDDLDGTTFVLYARQSRAADVGDAVARIAGVAVGAPERVDATDWSEAWKHGLVATIVSPRLVVRPPFAAAGQTPGAVEIVIRPAQAFGTGGHPSTMLALAWIDEIAPGLAAPDRVLDVGTGSGVLALAALALGPARAVGIDLDGIAVREARENAVANGFERRLALAHASADAVRSRCADLIVVNLLRGELEPLLADLARCAQPGAHAVFSGLLDADCPVLAPDLARHGFREIGRRSAADAGGDVWVALLTQT